MSDDPRDPLPAGDGEGEPSDEIRDDDLGTDGDGDEEEALSEEEADVEGSDEEDAEEGKVTPPPRTSRGRNTFGRLREENRELRERLNRVEQTVTQPRPYIDPAAQQREQQEQFNREYQERFQNDPQAATAWLWQRGQQQIGAALQQQEARMLDRQDEREWNRSLQSNRFAQRFKDAVERDVQTLRSQGSQYINREMLLQKHVGEYTLNRAQAEGPRQRAAAQRRVARQTTRPASGRGDGAANRGRRGSEDDDDIALLKETPLGNF
mgnify:CR=1 FL=1